MERTVRYYTFDYENDTAIDYVNTGAYSMLNCSYTSEDEDYGTDTIHYGVGSKRVKSMEEMAYEMVGELTRYLNKKDFGRYGDITDAEKLMFGDYSNSTLYAIEKALKNIADGYRPRKWFGHLEDVCREIAKRMVKDGSKNFSICMSNEEEQEQYSPEEYEGIGSAWFGVKRLDPVFDNEPYEFIVGIGYYGGGSFASAYAYDDGSNVEFIICELARSICNAFEKLDDFKPQSIVYTVEEKEDK